jgi:hypothetical protein
MRTWILRSFSLVVASFVATDAWAQPASPPQPPPAGGFAETSDPTLPPPPGGPQNPPPHWLDRNIGPGDWSNNGPNPVAPLQPVDWMSLVDLYLRLDFGKHKEIGFPEDDGLGLELAGRVRLPQEPWLSIVADIRNEFIDGGDRFGWTIGGFGEWGLLRAGGGIDGIHDNRSDSDVGNGFLFISQDLPAFCARIGIWSTFELWDDIHAFTFQPAPNIIQVIRSGVEPYEATSFFVSKSLGPEGRWGDIYFAPGFEHHDGRFKFSVGYQGTIVDQLDAFIHYHQTASGDRDWSLFAGLQFHLGCSGNRPFDFMMPQRIRSRQMFRTTVDTFIF